MVFNVYLFSGAVRLIKKTLTKLPRDSCCCGIWLSRTLRQSPTVTPPRFPAPLHLSPFSPPDHDRWVDSPTLSASTFHFLSKAFSIFTVNQPRVTFQVLHLFSFFFFSFIRIHGKLDLFQYAINIKDIWVKESRVKRGIKRLSKSAVSSIFSTDAFKYIHLHSTQSLLSNSFNV